MTVDGARAAIPVQAAPDEPRPDQPRPDQPRPGWMARLTGPSMVALASPNFRLYIVGQLVTQSGAWMQRTAQAWLVLDLTGSPLALGTLTALQFGPILVLSLFAGVIVDRLPKRQLLMVTQLLSSVQAIVLAILTISGQIQLWQLYVLAMVLGTLNAFEFPTRQAFVSDLVGRDLLRSAVSLNSSVFNGARIMGPALGGLVIAAWGVGWCFLLNGIGYVAVLGALLLMRVDLLQTSRRSARAPVWSQLKDGVRYAATRRELAFPLALLAFMGMLGYNFSVTLPLLARYVVQVDAVGFGGMNAAVGIGSLLGALSVAARVSPSHRVLVAMAALFSLLLLAVALTPVYVLLLGLLFVLGVVSVVYSSSTNTSIQLRAREEYRGRVLSLYTLLFAGSTPIGGAVTGLLSARLGVQAAMALQAGVLLAVSLSGWLFLRYLPGRPAAT